MKTIGNPSKVLQHVEKINKNLPPLTPPSRLKELFATSPATGYRLEANPDLGFPKRVKITPGGTKTAWVTQELLDWFLSRPRVHGSLAQ